MNFQKIITCLHFNDTNRMHVIFHLCCDPYIELLFTYYNKFLPYFRFWNPKKFSWCTYHNYEEHYVQCVSMATQFQIVKSSRSVMNFPFLSKTGSFKIDWWRQPHDREILHNITPPTFYGEENEYSSQELNKPEVETDSRFFSSYSKALAKSIL